MMLAGSRAEGAFLLRSLLDPPWSLRIEDHAPITVLVLVRGSAVVVSDTGQTEDLEAGDVALLRGPDPYTVADHPDTPVHVLIDEAQNCAAVDGSPLEDMSVHGIRTWGNSTSGQTVMLTGTYRLDSYVSRQILDSLTPVAVVRRSIETAPMTNLLEQQIAADGPGQEVLFGQAPGPGPDLSGPDLVRREPESITAMDQGLRGSRHRACLAAHTQSAGTPLDSREPGPGVRQLASGLRAPVHQPHGARTCRLSDRVALVGGGGSTRRPSTNGVVDRARSGLLEPLCPHNRVHPSSRNEPEDVPPDPLCAFINRPRLIKAHSKYLNEPKPPPTRGSNDELR